MNQLTMPPKRLLRECVSFAGLTTYQHLRYEFKAIWLTPMVVMVFI